MQCQKVSFQGNNSAIKFRLKPETCKAISESTRLTIDEMKHLSPDAARDLMIQRGAMQPKSSKKDIKRIVDFSKEHPDLAPRNVYLREGRIATSEEINKQIDDFLKEPLHVRVVNWFKNKFNKE